MKKREITLAIAAVFLALLAACNEPTGPGSDNTANTGSILRVTKMDVVDPMTDGWQVDVASTICSISDSGTIEEWETLKDVVIEVTLKNDTPYTAESCETGYSCDESPQGTGIYVNSYTVEYVPGPLYPNGPNAPELTTQEFAATGIYLAPNSALVSTLVAMRVVTKDEYRASPSPITSPGDQPVYEFKVTFYGVNQFNQEVEVTASAYAVLAEYCSECSECVGTFW